MRDKHTFEFSAGKIATAAAQEARYHSDRIEWWEKEYAAAKDEVRSAGIRVVEGLGTGGVQTISAYIDAGEHLTRAQECLRKIRVHREACDRLRVESATYDSQNPHKLYELSPEDVLYFRLAGGPRED